MCHEWWLRRWDEEREASRRMWDEFDRTRPLSDPEPAVEDSDVVLEQEQPAPIATKH